MDGIALFNALGLELTVNALDTPDILEAAHRFVIEEIRHGNQFFYSLAIHYQLTADIAGNSDFFRIFLVLIINLRLILRLRLLNVVIKPLADIADKLLDALMRRSRYLKELQTLFLSQLFQPWQIICRIRNIDLIRDQYLRALCDLFAIFLELCINLMIVFNRITAFNP